jgi:SH3-like domain-containing protein
MTRIGIRWPSLALAILLLVFAPQVFAERLTVASPVGNVRSGPGTNYAVMWQVERYHPISVVEKSGPWYRFQDFEKDEGWIHKSLLDDTPAVITDRNKCNVRSGPGMKNEILFSVGKGIPFKVLGREGQWIHIEHADGDRGWIHQSLVW